MTIIGIQKRAGVTEDRTWLLSSHGTDPGMNPSVTLDVSKFADPALKNGVIRSGTALGKITATGLYGPFDASATDGRQTPVGLLFGSLPVKLLDGTNAARVAGAYLMHGRVKANKLPIALDATAQAKLPHIVFEA